MRTSLVTRMATGSVARRAAIGFASAIVGLTLSAAFASPASAAPVGTTPPPSTPPALSAWLNSSTVTAGAPASARPELASPSFAKAAALAGKRTTFTRGGPLAWASDTFEWYWSGSAMSSSTGWQGRGYIFPNTVTLQGVKRTLASSGQHNWRGTATIGAGVVTPWGAVDVYQTSTTDYFALTPGGGFSHSS